MWQQLSDPEIQRSLAFYGGGAATAIGGLWVAWTRLADRKAVRPPPPVSPTPTSRAEHGITAGGAMHVHGNVTNSTTPTLAWVIMALGILLLGAVALFGRGDCTPSVDGKGVASCGDANGNVVSG